MKFKCVTLIEEGDVCFTLFVAEVYDRISNEVLKFFKHLVSDLRDIQTELVIITNLIKRNSSGSSIYI